MKGGKGAGKRGLWAKMRIGTAKQIRAQTCMFLLKIL